MDDVFHHGLFDNRAKVVGIRGEMELNGSVGPWMLYTPTDWADGRAIRIFQTPSKIEA